MTPQNTTRLESAGADGGVQASELDTVVQYAHVGGGGQVAGDERLSRVDDQRRHRAFSGARLEGSQGRRFAAIEPRERRPAHRRHVAPFLRVNINEVQYEGDAVERWLQGEPRHAGAVRKHQVGALAPAHPFEHLGHTWSVEQAMGQRRVAKQGGGRP